MKYLFIIIINLFSFSACSEITYPGRQQDSEWRNEANLRIEDIRKADISILVHDKDNNPIANADVHLKMKRHAFAFGSAVGAKFLTAEDNDSKEYQKLVLTQYNKVVLENDLKFSVWDKSKTNPPESTYRIEQTFKALNWLNNNNIIVRGHYLAWGRLQHYQNFLEQSEIYKNLHYLLNEHINEKVSKVGNLVTEWDAINHPLSLDNKKNLESLYGQNVYAELLGLAKTLEPDLLLYVNEGGMLAKRPNSNEKINRYENLIKRIVIQGAPLDGIGFMGHVSKEHLRPPTELLEILDRFSVFDLPIQITEFDVRFGKRGKLYSFSDRELKLQADYTRDFMTAMFSHPAVNGIIMWGFWEGRHWYPGAALYRMDWSKKPNGKVWEDLVFNKWWTNIKTKTDSSGFVNQRAFLGEYDILATYGNKKILVPITLTKNGAEIEIIMTE